MKKKTYAIITRIPIIGSVVRLRTKPIQLFGSFERESGIDKHILDICNSYAEKRPDEQITMTFVKKLLEQDSKTNGG